MPFTKDFVMSPSKKKKTKPSSSSSIYERKLIESRPLPNSLSFQEGFGFGSKSETIDSLTKAIRILFPKLQRISQKKNLSHRLPKPTFIL